MSQLEDNGNVVSLHRDLAEANGQLREMKNTMTEILKAMVEFRHAIDGLKAWQAAMTVESRVDKNEIQELRDAVAGLKSEIAEVKIGHAQLITKINTLRWIGSVIAALLGFVSANREWFGLK